MKLPPLRTETIEKVLDRLLANKFFAEKENITEKEYKKVRFALYIYQDLHMTLGDMMRTSKKLKKKHIDFDTASSALSDLIIDIVEREGDFYALEEEAAG